VGEEVVEGEDAALAEGEFAVEYPLGIYVLDSAQTFAGFAGAKRRVKGEHPRFDL